MKKLFTFLGSVLVSLGVKAEANTIVRKETSPAPRYNQADTTVPVQTTIKSNGNLSTQKAHKGNTLTMKELPAKDFKYFKEGVNKDSLATPVKGNTSNLPIKIGTTNNKVPLKNGKNIPFKD